MGTDIHVFIEYRVNDGEWQADPHHVFLDGEYPRLRPVTTTGRDYELFAALAGVRGEGPEPKGLPEDVSPQIKTEADRFLGHSYSYISVKQFKKILTKQGYDFSNTSKEAFYNYDDYDCTKNLHPQNFTTIVNYCEDMENNIDWVVFDKHVLNDGEDKYKIDVRLVFWFDS